MNIFQKKYCTSECWNTNCTSSSTYNMTLSHRSCIIIDGFYVTGSLGDNSSLSKHSYSWTGKECKSFL